MGSIRIFDPSAHEFLEPRNAYPASVVTLISDAELDGSSVRWHHPGSETELQLFEMALEPGIQLSPHAHAADEIIAVLSGGLTVGQNTYGPGASIYVEGGTLYSVTAGPAGCRFLNFRAAMDKTYFTPSTHREMLRGKGRSNELKTYVAWCEIDADPEVLAELRPSHQEYVAQHRNQLVGGGVIGSKAPIGVLFIIEASDVDGARAFVSNDPYYRIYGDVRVEQYLQRVAPTTRSG